MDRFVLFCCLLSAPALGLFVIGLIWVSYISSPPVTDMDLFTAIHNDLTEIKQRLEYKAEKECR